MQNLAVLTQDWESAPEPCANPRACPIASEAVPADPCPARQSLVAAHDRIVRLRDGIVERKGLRLKDVERIRTLGIDPLYRYRVFEVDRTTDEILAVWSISEGVCGPPHWSEITAHLDRLAGLVEQALSDHNSLQRWPKGRALLLLTRDAGLMGIAESAQQSATS